VSEPSTARRDVVLLLALAGPPLLLAAGGLAHPSSLTAGTADRWHGLHLVLLLVFPLLGLGPWLLARRIAPRLGWATAVLCFGYACCYTALDVLSGIGAGALQQAGAVDGVAVAFHEGDRIGAVGTEAYWLATIVAASLVLAVARARRAALTSAVVGTVLVLAGAWSFRTSHVFAPRGVVTVLGLAAGWTLLALALLRAERSTPRTSSA
jgi:hypothetical protein